MVQRRLTLGHMPSKTESITCFLDFTGGCKQLPVTLGLPISVTIYIDFKACALKLRQNLYLSFKPSTRKWLQNSLISLARKSDLRVSRITVYLWSSGSLWTFVLQCSDRVSLRGSNRRRGTSTMLFSDKSSGHMLSLCAETGQCFPARIHFQDFNNLVQNFPRFVFIPNLLYETSLLGFSQLPITFSFVSNQSTLFQHLLEFLTSLCS